MAPIRTGAASWRPPVDPGRRSTRQERLCGSGTSTSSKPALRVPSTASASARSSVRRVCASRSISALRRARAKPGGPTSPKSTCGSMPNTPRKDLLVLKIGGSVGAENDAALDAVVALNDAGHPLVVVHGGGPLVGEWAERLGMETRFVRGLRVSDASTRDVALAGLGGLANGRLVASILGHG